MKQLFTSTVRPMLRRLGVDVVRFHDSATEPVVYPRDFTREHVEICDAVAPYTMTGPIRVHALVNAVHYLVANGIEGAMVECGVWKGGSMMAVAQALRNAGDESRDLYLYDTYAGMSAPTDADVTIRGRPAHEKFAETRTAADASDWCYAPLDQVRQNVLSTGYPASRWHFVEGKVEDTLPTTRPDRIALLRLDSDWYESTKWELTHLFPLLQPSGVLILDDYGFWQGARKAVDEYIRENGLRLFLNRIDSCARLAINAG